MRITSVACLGSRLLVLGLQGCALNPQPSHGADNTPSGVSIYGSIDVGVGKTQRP